MASRADLIRKAKERLEVAQALHDYVHMPTAGKGGTAGGRPMHDATTRMPAVAGIHQQGHGPTSAATPIQPKPEAARAQQVERTYGPGAGDRRTARAEFAREHGEANADYRTWSPAHVAAAKRAGLFGGTVPASGGAMPRLLRAARGQAAERGQFLPHVGLGGASQGAEGRPSGAEIVRALEQRLAGMTPAVQITRRRRPPIRLS